MSIDDIVRFKFNIPEFAGGLAATAQPARPSHSKIHNTTIVINRLPVSENLPEYCKSGKILPVTNLLGVIAPARHL